MNGPIRLAGLKPVGRGSHRVCYRHPGHPDRCVKVLLANVPASNLDAPHIVADSLRRDRAADENQLELETYLELERENNPALWDHIPRGHGMVDTDLGPGLVTDYIAGVDGEPAESLARRIDRNYDASCRAAVEELKAFLLKHLVRIGDLHQSNLLICVPRGAQRERIYIIDGLADRHFLWWRCFHPLRRLKVKRKIQRMEFRIRCQLAENAKRQPA
jgi:PhoP regulatory network protein YrbL